ncbi:hypothetical protein H0I23_12555 [Cellulophaga sp. HaHaR_3_176]|uniref:hypothetical protein n=1 Tax=Cellulophaga sp. HaHaR_3_176 TaxID=1942464 RepID=UPI001C1FC918|nr:hypothetical protein [Cellulophaga sp. HaHaR_3_176]QWX83277.1 hypothetical protein H0I23_12555 [Cellulophaga sp. HaHaR_3_176]
MKKVILASVFTFVGLTAFAQESDTAMNTETVVVVATQDSFTEVANDQLPEAVTAAVGKNYPTASIDKSYVNDKEQYKLEVSLEDGTAGTVYADKEGNWLDM